MPKMMSEATTVNETGSYVLANPVTVKQGDLYAFVVDRSTTNAGTFVVYYGTRKGAVNAHRSFIGSVAAVGVRDLVLVAVVVLAALAVRRPRVALSHRPG